MLRGQRASDNWCTVKKDWLFEPQSGYPGCRQAEGGSGCERFTLVLKTNCLRGSWFRIIETIILQILTAKQTSASHMLPSKAWVFPWHFWLCSYSDLFTWLSVRWFAQVLQFIGLFHRKPAFSGDCLSFLVTFLSSLMVLTTLSAEPYPFHKWQSWSNVVLHLDLYSKSGPNFPGENGPGILFFLKFWSPGLLFSPDQNFCDSACSEQVDICTHESGPKIMG